MRNEAKRSSLSMLVIQRNILFFTAVALLIMGLFLGVAAFRTQSITLFKAPETKIDLLGAESQGQFLTHLLLNKSLSTSKEQNKSLLSWVDPMFSFKLNRDLQKQTKDMEESQTSFEWALLDSAVESLGEKTVRVFLRGNLSSYLPIQNGKKQLIQSEESSFILDLNLKNGKLLLSNFRKGEKHV